MKKSRFKLSAFILLLFLIDRVTKSYFVSRFQPGEGVSVIGDALRFTLVFNQGAAFGSLQGRGVFLAVLSLAILAVLLVMLARGKDHEGLARGGLVLIISGALGNLFDRLKYGHVIDFIDADIPDIVPGLTRWYVFNLADSFISVGMMLIVFYVLTKKEGDDAPGAA